MPSERQKALRGRYKGIELQPGDRLDLVVGSPLVVKLKSVEQLLPVHETQVITYLKLRGLWVGLLVNFQQPSGTACAASRTTKYFPAPRRPVFPVTANTYGEWGSPPGSVNVNVAPSPGSLLKLTSPP
jgi:hypothetical protein